MADPFEMPDGVEEEIDEQEVTQPEVAPEERAPSSGFARPGARDSVALAAKSYVSALEKSQKTNAEIMQDAQRVLLQRANEPMDAGAWFRIAAAFGKPTRTGSFGESLGNVNEVLGSEADKKLKAKRDLEEMQMKYKMQLGSQAADLSKAQFDAYVRTAGIKEPPPSKIRQLQIEASGLPQGSPERTQIEKQIERLNTPKPAATKQQTEKQWALQTLRDYNIDPSTINPKDVELANVILGANKPAIDKREIWTGDEANASIELFGTTDSSEQTSAQRKQVRDRAIEIRRDTAAAGRAPKEPKPPKEKAVNVDEFPIIAQQLGVPFVDSPYKNVSDKTAQTLLINNARAAEKKLGTYESSAAKTGTIDQYVDKFLGANKKAPTGRERSYLPSFGADYQTMESVTAQLAPENRKEGTGSVSDFDAKQLIKGTLSISNNYETNKRIGQGLKAANQMARDKARFMSDFYQANRHLQGAEKEWQRYVTANPIFDKNAKEGSFVLNPRRMTYKQFFYPPEQRAQGGMVGMVNNYQGYGDLASLRQKYAQGGAVMMQEGGDPEEAPVESVVRLKRMPPASDTANRARAFFGQGMGASFGDEAEALYRRYLTDDGKSRSYENILNEVRADYRRFSEENPGQALTFELAGGVAPTVGAMMLPGGQAGAAPQAGRVGQLVSKYAPALTKTPTRRMATSGAGYGAVSGFGAGEGGVGNRLAEAGESGAIGAVAGPLVGKGGELLYQGGKRLWNRAFTPGMNMYEEKAFAKVLDKMNQDRITPRQAVTQVAEERGYMPSTKPAGTRPRTQLRDVSPGLTDLAETVANRPGAGRKAIVEDVLKTGRSTKGRVSDVIQERVAKGKNMFNTEMELTDNLRGNADTLYDNAYSFGTVKDPRILDMLNQPEFKEAYRQVLETNKIRKANAVAKGQDPSKFDMEKIYDIREIHPGVYEMNLVAAPDVKTLDQIKRGLDYKIRTGRKSTNAAEQDAAHALNEYKNTFLDILDETVPAYKVARQQYRGDLEVLDALDIGRTQFGKMSPEQASAYASKLSPAERDAVRVGYAQQFIDKIGNSKNAINAAEEVLGAPNNVQRLQALFDTPQEFEVFKGILRAESRNVKSGQQIAANSATGRRKELQKEFEGDSVATQMMDLASGSPFSTFMRLIKKAPDLFKNEQVAENVSKILNTGKPAELNKLLRDLEERATKFAAERSRIEKVGTTGSKGVGRMAGETPIGADVEDDEFVPPSAVEGGNDGVDVAPVIDDIENPMADEEEPREYRRGGGANRMPYGNQRQQLMMKYGAPQRQDMPTDYRGGGMVSHKALGGVVRKMHK